MLSLYYRILLLTNRFYSFILSNLIYFYVQNYVDTLILLHQLTINIKLKK